MVEWVDIDRWMNGIEDIVDKIWNAQMNLNIDYSME